MNSNIDFIDKKILRALLSKGRSTFAELAAQVGLTAPTVHDRVKKLERGGIIQGYTAILNPGMLGYEMTALIQITTSNNIAARDYEAKLSQIPEIQECYSVAGDATYVARVLTKNPRTLEGVLQRIRNLAGTLSTKATVVLSAPIHRHTLPMDEEIHEFPGDTSPLARSQSVRCTFIATRTGFQSVPTGGA
jgi:Lrp/AsnC family leucine-responsive transcriptional regulator